MAVVKIEFPLYNRTYTVGIKQFLSLAGIEMSDADIERTVNLVLNSQGAPK